MKYMNDMYDLKSSDVKMCISNVLKIYAFSINSGILNVEIPSLQTFLMMLRVLDDAKISIITDGQFDIAYNQLRLDSKK